MPIELKIKQLTNFVSNLSYFIESNSDIYYLPGVFETGKLIDVDTEIQGDYSYFIKVKI